MMSPLVLSLYRKVLLLSLLKEPGFRSGFRSATTEVKPSGVNVVVVGRSAGAQMPASPPLPAPGQNTHKSPIKYGRYGGFAPCIGRPHPPNIHFRFPIVEPCQVAAKSLPPGVFRSAAGDAGGGSTPRP